MFAAVNSEAAAVSYLRAVVKRSRCLDAVLDDGQAVSSSDIEKCIVVAAYQPIEVLQYDGPRVAGYDALHRAGIKSVCLKLDISANGTDAGKLECIRNDDAGVARYDHFVSRPEGEGMDAGAERDTATHKGKGMT